MTYKLENLFLIHRSLSVKSNCLEGQENCLFIPSSVGVIQLVSVHTLCRRMVQNKSHNCLSTHDA